MYQIIYENECIGYTDEPLYIKDKNGVWIECKKEEAEGIAYKSTAYVGATAREYDSYKVITEADAELEKVITDIEINQMEDEQNITNIEITQIEDEQILTDHDIAILELQSKEA